MGVRESQPPDAAGVGDHGRARAPRDGGDHGGGSSDADLLAAALASLAIGLLPYSAFLLFARAFYALGDSRTPAVIALVTASVGAVVMVVGALSFHGAAVVAALGIGNTVAYLLGSLVLTAILGRRLGHHLIPTAVWKPLVLSVAMGLALWATERAIAPEGRITTLVVLLVLVVVAGAAYLGFLQLLARPATAPTATRAATVSGRADATELDPDLAEDL